MADYRYVLYLKGKKPSAMERSDYYGLIGSIAKRVSEEHQEPVCGRIIEKGGFLLELFTQSENSAKELVKKLKFLKGIRGLNIIDEGVVVFTAN